MSGREITPLSGVTVIRNTCDVCPEDLPDTTVTWREYKMFGGMAIAAESGAEDLWVRKVPEVVSLDAWRRTNRPDGQ